MALLGFVAGLAIIPAADDGISTPSDGLAQASLSYLGLRFTGELWPQAGRSIEVASQALIWYADRIGHPGTALVLEQA